MKNRPYAILIATIFTLLFLLFLYNIAEILLLLFIAVLFSLYLSSITDALQRRFRVPRPAGLVIALLVTALAVAGIAWMLLPALLSQTDAMLDALPVQFARWEVQLRELAARQPLVAEMLPELEEGDTYVGQMVSQITGYFANFELYLFSGIGFAIHFVSVLVMGIFMTLRPGLYREGLIVLFPPVHRELARDILDDLNRTLRAWIVGLMLMMITMGLFTWIGFIFLGVPYALAFSVFTGAAAIVPFFGTIVSTLLPAVVVIGTGGMLAALLVLLWGVVVHLFEANVVAPMIMERQVSLPPVLTLLSVLIMGHLLHFIGLLVAVPVLATVMVIVRRIYIQRMLEGHGFRRAVRDQAVNVQLPDRKDVLVHPAAFDASVPALLEG